MSQLKSVTIGVVGAAGRGGSFRAALEANGARVRAVCDIRRDRLEECARSFGTEETYTDYRQMLERSNLDAVVIATPMPLHVEQSIAALERGIHVLCEVPAGVSVEECRRLVEASAASTAVYMMAENYTYRRHNVLVRELVRRGLFGTPYYAEGEYLHNVRDLAERTTWRLAWQLGIDGVTYGTHSLGPILQWMPGDRVCRVSCQGSGAHHTDPRGTPYAQDTSVMLCKTASGALVKIRVDLVSDRPHAMTNYQLQGTDGVYESSRGAGGEHGRIWFRELSEKVEWIDVESLFTEPSLAGRYLPELWRDPPEEARRAGHGGGDYFEILDFLDAVRGTKPPPIGIHEAMDMTLPGLVSQQSIAKGGAWLDVPDSRRWPSPPARQQLLMEWPEERLSSPPAVSLPEGYALRCYAESDEAAYIELMAKAGFTDWTSARVRQAISRVLPGGFFLVEHGASGRIVATAMASHGPTARHPYGGELGWVAADPEHAGRRLGLSVCAAATRRFLDAGYRNIYLKTDDHRLAALKTYLKLGYRPVMHAEDMPARWKAVTETLGI